MHISGALIALLVPLVAALLASVIQRNLKERERFSKAADDFRNAFSRAISELIDLREVVLKGGFSLEYVAHRQAMVAFRQILSQREKREFDKAWNKYKEYCDTKSSRAGDDCLFPYRTDYAPPWKHAPEIQIENAAKEALGHINSLLSFTNKNFL